MCHRNFSSRNALQSGLALFLALLAVLSYAANAVAQDQTGQYPSEGAGGSIEDFLMPEDITVQLTVGRAVGVDGSIHLEGTGVVPTVRVPVTLDTLKKEANGEDVVLAAAEKVISQR